MCIGLYSGRMGKIPGGFKKTTFATRVILSVSHSFGLLNHNKCLNWDASQEERREKSREDKEGKKGCSSKKVQEADLEIQESDHEQRFRSTFLEGSLAEKERRDELQERGFTDFDRERQLCNYYEANPLFWDPCHEDYKNKTKRQVMREFSENIDMAHQH